MKRVVFFTLTFCGLLKAQKFENVFALPAQNNVYAMASNTAYVFAGTGGSGIFRSGDNGENWQEISAGGGYFFSLLSSGDSLFAGGFGTVDLSTNNGTTWTSLNLSLSLNDYVLTINKNEQYVFAGIKQKGFYRRSLNGGSWQAKNSGLHSLVSVNDLLVWGSLLLAATDKGIYMSMDNGDSWIITTAVPASVAVNKLYYDSSKSLALAGTVNGIYKGGSHVNTPWTLVSAAPPYVPVVGAFAMLNNTLFGGMSGSTVHGLMLSTDDGTTWNTYSASPIAAMPFVSLTAKGPYVFAGNSGYISRYSDGPVGISETTGTARALSVFPNPCRESIVVNIPETAVGAEFKLCDLQGREVLTTSLLGKENKVNVQDLQPGVYMASVRSAGYTKVLKLIRE